MPASQARVAALVEEFFKPLINQGQAPNAAKAPGGICGVFFQGQASYFPYGYINPDNAIADENTVFGIGSVTKTLTTSILGQMPGLFNANVNDLLPPGYNLSPGMADLNFAELATFTSGIGSVPPKTLGGEQATQEQFIEFINSENPASLPAPNVYSDSSIGFLGQLLMYKDSCKKFGWANATAWYKAHLLDALSMNNTFAESSPVPGTNWSFPYKYKNGAYETCNYERWAPWGTAGRAYSTCSDLINFVQANCGISEINGKKIRPTILEGMTQAQLTRTGPQNPHSPVLQAFAWIVFNAEKIGMPYSSNTFCAKDGGVTGVSSFITACPAQKLGVVLLTNLQGVDVKDAAVNITNGLIGFSTNMQ